MLETINQTQLQAGFEPAVQTLHNKQNALAIAGIFVYAKLILFAIMLRLAEKYWFYYFLQQING